MSNNIILGQGKKYLSQFDTLFLREQNNITTICIHSDVECILPKAFSNMHSLKKVVFLSGSQCKTISEESFLACIHLQQINLPIGLKEIKKRAFQYCFHLTKIIIPSTVTHLHSMSFSFCTHLTTLAIFAKKLFINPNAFVGTRISTCYIGNDKYFASQIHERLFLYVNKHSAQNKNIARGTLVDRINNYKAEGRTYVIAWDEENLYFPVSRYWHVGFGKDTREAWDHHQYLITELEFPERFHYLTEDDELTREEYAIITGACKYGIEEFLEKEGLSDRETISIKEIISRVEDTNISGKKYLQILMDNNKKRKQQQLEFENSHN